MTHSDFNHLLGSINALTPGQAWQLRQQLDKQFALPKQPAASTTGKSAKRAKAATPKKKPVARDELNRQLMAEGLITSLPDPALDIDDDDPDDQPIAIKGEPLSETIIRERR